MAGIVSCSWRVGQCAGVTALVLLFGSEGLQNVAADGDTRSLSLHHMHTGEDITITFKQAGRYDDEALKKLDWFLRDWRREQSTNMDPHLLDLIWEVYREVDAKEPVQVVCGYRSPQTNAMLRNRSRGVAQHSLHMAGKAMDFYIPGVPLEQLRYAGLRMQRGGVGFYPTSGSPFVHLDTGNVRHWPRMSPVLLARVLHDKPAHRPTTQLAQAQNGGAASENIGATAATGKPKRGLIAKMFGFGSEEDQAVEAERAGSDRAGGKEPPRKVAAPKKDPRQYAVSTKPVRVTTAAAAPVRPARFTLASVSPLPPAPQSPAEVVHARATWTGAEAAVAVTALAERSDARAATPAGATNASGERLVWISGPEGQPAPRPPQEIVLASADPQPNGEIEAVSTFTRKDRVGPELALAYAANTPLLHQRPRPTPMGSLGVAPAPAPTTTTDSRPRTMIHRERIDNPWLRSIVVAPSVHYSMNVSVLGPTDYRVLRPLFAKPSFAVAMAFSDDPHLGMNAEGFGGAAVEFLPTVIFASRTAGLQ